MLMTACRCGPRPGRAAQVKVVDAGRAAKFDPTGTLALRNKFCADMDQRWSRMRRLMLEAIDRNDHLGLRGMTSAAIVQSNHSMLFPTAIPGGDNVKSVQAWIDEAMRQIVLGFDGGWMTRYIAESADMARTRAAKLLGREVGSDTDRIRAIISLTVVELQGVMEAVSQQAIRAFTEGHLARQRPSIVARKVAAIAVTIGRARGRMLVNTMIVKMFSAATLDAFRSAGVRQVGTTPERLKIVKGAHGKTLARDAMVVTDAKSGRSKSKRKAPTARQQKEILRREAKIQALEEVEILTAGDDAVCQICEDISDEGPYSIDEAESLIPAHISCRCAFINASDERFASVHGDAGVTNASGHGRGEA